jgi:hypothetical protein
VLHEIVWCFSHLAIGKFFVLIFGRFNYTMRKESKLILFTIICFSVAIGLIVYRYEGLLKSAEKAGQLQESAATTKKYTASEIIQLIKTSKEYIGDSVTILDNGDLLSSNGKFQGTISAIVNGKDNMNAVNMNTAVNKLPVQVNIYQLAATYYRMQYPDEFKNGKLPNPKP